MKILLINCSPVKDGATQEIVNILTKQLAKEQEAKSVCIADYDIAFCTGCRKCHETARCVLDEDGADELMKEFAWAEALVCVSPSYWAGVPAQFKAFIDRCTPWADTHEPHAAIEKFKLGFSVALRTGKTLNECLRIHQTIQHFYSHLKILPCGSLSLSGMERKEDVTERKEEILAFAKEIKAVLAQSERIQRVAAYEEMFAQADTLLESEENREELSSLIDKLTTYYEKDWRSDFEADEEGLIPKTIRRGVLSEDGLYDLLEAYNEIKEG